MYAQFTFLILFHMLISVAKFLYSWPLQSLLIFRCWLFYQWKQRKLSVLTGKSDANLGGKELSSSRSLMRKIRRFITHRLCWCLSDSVMLQVSFVNTCKTNCSLIFNIYQSAKSRLSFYILLNLQKALRWYFSGGFRLYMMKLTAV